MKQGFVYVMTNPSFKDDWVKIGYSTGNPAKRAKELDNTAVPLPFEIFASLQTKRCKEAEKLIHRFVRRLNQGLRIRENREFFNIKPEVAAEILEDVSGVLGDSASVVFWTEGKPVTKHDGKSRPQIPSPSPRPQKQQNRYSETALLRGKPSRIKKLYAELKTGILRLGNDITVEPQKLYASFKAGKKRMCSVEIGSKQLRIIISAKKGSLSDPFGMTSDVSQKGHWGSGDYRVNLCDATQLQATLDLIAQTLLPPESVKSEAKNESESIVVGLTKIADVKDISGKKIEYIVFQGCKMEFDNLRDAFVTIVAKMAETAPGKLLGTEISTRLGISSSNGKLRRPAKIADGWFVETNNDSNRKIIFVKEACRALGMEDELSFKFK